MTPSHHAPTAVTMPIGRRARLLSAANEQDFVIVEDDYEFEMSFLTPPSPALKSLDRAGRVIYIGSFSKALFPGLRLGYLVGPKPFIREARQLRSLMLRHPPGHQQRTVAYFLALGHYDGLIRDMRKAFAERRDVMTAALENEGLEISGASSFGGTNLWIKGPDGLDSFTLARDLRDDGVLIEPGAPFFENDRDPIPFFRMAYSSIQADRIEEGREPDRDQTVAIAAHHTSLSAFLRLSCNSAIGAIRTKPAAMVASPGATNRSETSATHQRSALDNGAMK